MTFKNLSHKKVVNKRGRLYAKFIIAAALIVAVVYAYSVFASAPFEGDAL